MAWMDNFISASDFDSIRLSVASRDDILNWSYGEVTKPETIKHPEQNHRIQIWKTNYKFE